MPSVSNVLPLNPFSLFLLSTLYTTGSSAMARNMSQSGPSSSLHPCIYPSNASTSLLTASPTPRPANLSHYDTFTLYPPIFGASPLPAPPPSPSPSELLWLDDSDILSVLSNLPLPLSSILSSLLLSTQQADVLRKIEEEGTPLCSLPKDERVRWVEGMTRLLTRGDPQLQAVVLAKLLCKMEGEEEKEEVAQMFTSRLVQDDSIVPPLLNLLHASVEAMKGSQKEEVESYRYAELPTGFIAARVVDLLTILLSSSPDWLLQRFVSALSSSILILSPKPQHIPLFTSALHSLSSLLHPSSAVLPDLLPLLSSLLIPSIPSHSFHYHLAFLLFLLSLSPSLHEDLHSLRIPPLLLLCLQQRETVEKRIRLYLSILLNLVKEAEVEWVEGMVEAGIVRVVEQLMGKEWRDGDISELLSALSSHLHSILPTLQSWSFYRSEILTVALHPSPLHSNPAFYSENVELFTANDGAVVKRLMGMAEDRRLADEVRSIAVWDVGEVARTGEAGKRVVERVRGRARLMRLTEEAPENVQHVAMGALQKLIVAKWDDFVRRCKSEVALTVTKPMKEVHEEDFKNRVQAYKYTFEPDVGGWPD